MLLYCSVEKTPGLQGVPTVHPKWNQSWIFIGRTDVEAETPILCPPDAKNWLIWKHPDAWKDWKQEERGTTEDEIVGWHHQLMSLSKLRQLVMDREACVLQPKELQTVRHDWAPELQQNVMRLNHPKAIPLCLFPQSVEKFSSMKLVPGAKKVGDHCL